MVRAYNDEIKKSIEFHSSDIGIKLVRSKQGEKLSKQVFTQTELDEIEQFKKTDVGEKYNKLSNNLSHKQAKAALKYVDSLK